LSYHDLQPLLHEDADPTARARLLPAHDQGPRVCGADERNELASLQDYPPTKSKGLIRTAAPRLRAEMISAWIGRTAAASYSQLVL
jgi:hypothetical protein